MTPLQIDFACKLSESPRRLTLDYTLTNREPVSIGLCNQIVRVRLDGTFEISPDLAYVTLDGSTLSIEKLLLPAPDDQLFGVPPFVTTVAPAASFSERIHMELPAKVKNPFRRARLRGQVVADRATRAQNLRFSLGIFALRDPTPLEASEPAYPALQEITHPERVRPLQQIITREFQTAEPIAVLDYRSVAKH